MTKQTEALKLALKRAFQYGVDHWYQADHDSYIENKKADETLAQFRKFVDKTCKALTAPVQQEPVGEVKRYGLDSHGRQWHGIYWYHPNVDVPHGTKLYTSPPAKQEADAIVTSLTAGPDGVARSGLDRELPLMAGVYLAPQPAQQEPVANYCRECLTYNGHHEGCSHYSSQPAQQEPVAWMIWTHGPVLVFMNKDEANMEFDRLNHAYPEPMRMLVPLYTSPQAQRTWVGLTDGDIEKLREKTFSTGNPYCPVDSKSMRKAARAIEAKLKEKNT